MGHQRLDLSLNELEAVGWNFDFQATVKLWLVLSIAPPNIDLDDFKTNLEKVLETISSERARATLVGDLNVDMKGKRLTPQSRSLNQLFNLYQLNQLVQEPTRITEHASSLIDLAYTSTTPQLCNKRSFACLYSSSIQEAEDGMQIYSVPLL